MGAGFATSTFAGRERELDVLVSSFGQLDSTGARAVLVTGDAGIGKSRLVDELRSRAEAAGALVGVGTCMPTEGGGLPYGPFVGLLRDLARRLDDGVGELLDGPRRALGLADPVNNDVTGHSTMALAKTRRFEVILDACSRLATRSRLVLVLEDLQWADAASIEVFEFLVRNLATEPMLLVATYRTDEMVPDWALRRLAVELGRHPRVDQMELGPLDRDATGALMRDVLGHAPDWPLLDAVHSRSGGNPFFAEELTAARDATTLPTALRNVVMFRIDALDAPARHAAVLTAVAGGSIDHRLLTAIWDHEDGSVEDAVAGAVSAHVLVPAPDGRYGLRHALQREALCDATLPAERARLHGQLAEAISEHPDLAAAGPGHAPVELAEHWWGAGAWAHALPAAVTAGDAMMRLLAFPEAHAQYERAMQAWDHLGDDRVIEGIELDDLLLRAADAAYLTEGQGERGVELARRALDACDTDRDPRRAASALTMLGRNAWGSGRLDEAFGALRQAIELLEPLPPTVELAEVLAEEARCLMLAARELEAIDCARAAVELATRVGARLAEAQARCTLGVALVTQGASAEGVGELRRSVAMAEDIGQPDLLQRVYANITYALIFDGRLDEAVTVVDVGAASTPYATMIRLGSAGINIAEALIRSGRYDEAERLLGQLDDVGTGSCAFGPPSVRALLDLRRGRLASAGARLDAAVAIIGADDTVQVRGVLHVLRAEIALEEDRPEVAFAEIERALEVAAGTDDHEFRPEMCAVGVRALADWNESARARGRTIDVDKLQRTATSLVGEAEVHVKALGGDEPPAPPRVRAFLASARAERTRLAQSDADAWALAATRWQAAHEPAAEAYCRYREAEAHLHGRSGRGPAQDAVHEAWRIASDLGSPQLAGAIARLAERARLELHEEPRPEPSHLERVAEDLGLTRREVDVLDELARGHTDRQIAESLFISKKTVSVHVSSILRKLDATNRVDAGEIGQHAGLGVERG